MSVNFALPHKVRVTALVLALIFSGLSVGFILADNGASKKDNFTLGQLYFNAEESFWYPYDIEKAEYYYKLATQEEESVSNDELWYQLGRTHFIQGEFAEAITAFETQLELHGEVRANVYYMLGLTYAFKGKFFNTSYDWRLAEENFEYYVNTLYPETVFGRIDLAWIYFAQGKYEEMGPMLEIALEYDPRNPWTLNMYGLYLLNTNNAPGAADHFEQAKLAAAELTKAEWGDVYPGNDPAVWGTGIKEFNDIINKNLKLALLAVDS